MHEPNIVGKTKFTLSEISFEERQILPVDLEVTYRRQLKP